MTSDPVLDAVSTFGADAKRKLDNPAVSGEPEDQLRGPLEVLLGALARVTGLAPGAMAMVGESSIAALKSRPDYAVTVTNALVGFIEVKAPGKGSDPRRFRDAHDKAQWEKLRSLPNLLYTDGESFGLWRNGEAIGLVRLEGGIESAGAKLTAPAALLPLIRDFFGWQPISPRFPRELAHVTARLCRLLRDEVTEEMSRGLPALTSLANDWRMLLFPHADDAQFADGYAQAVTFGLLMARSRNIPLAGGLDTVAKALGKQDTLIGAALRLLTEEAEVEAALKTSLDTLTRVLDVVDWSVIAKGDPEAWLYFYEAFLGVYDNALRKKTGSYYTPPEVVTAMVRLTDEALVARFGLPTGLASPNVTVADPAVGSGTFLLGVLRQIGDTVRSAQGEGAVAAALKAATSRLIGFEIQFGPFAVAQLRMFAELVSLEEGAVATLPPLRLFVTDTLGDPNEAEENIPGLLRVLAQSRAEANRIKARQPITVVIGNPPYRENARDKGGWVVRGSANVPAPLADWIPPAEWELGTYVQHIHNLYIYFWRWAAWKVFGPGIQANERAGVVCFITAAGFLAGPGFQKMRSDLRRSCDTIWVIDCSPDGHQPPVATRIFQGVQQPVCIVLAERSIANDPEVPARVRFRALPAGTREAKFAALAALALDDHGWVDGPTGWRAPFLADSTAEWQSYPLLTALINDGGSGVRAGRTWVIAPDAGSLGERWTALQRTRDRERQAELFFPHLRNGLPADRHIDKLISAGLGAIPQRKKSVRSDLDPVISPVRYAFRSFDRQWIIPDIRLLQSPNAALWSDQSQNQVYLTAIDDRSPTDGPALTISALIPDMHHYAGRGGRVFPLWSDATASSPNFAPGLLELLTRVYGEAPAPEDLFAYIAAVAAQPGYIERFGTDLATPGLRIPLTANPMIFAEAAALGREVVWLHTYGERFIDPEAGRPHGPPRLPLGEAPTIPKAGAIPSEAASFPDTLDYDATANRLRIGRGYVDRVPPAVWGYTVSGKQVLRQWFSYRKKNRERPIIGDRRPPSPLGDIQPEGWLAQYTEDLIDLLNVLGRLVLLEGKQANLLARICAGALIGADTVAGAVPPAQPHERREGRKRRKSIDQAQPKLI
ncbi:MAG TPA: DNA methyltransferase [Aurantimonas coralicida]|uniref:site-specific DNA-methyltransferase (adenine-specific) n=2 Tax=root TaxID=1 RepID=A0A9C9THN8_9HYPH|nr:DNA methyltransferase [Aurantimonas coralicida]HEU00993.1 DNA methyltransferase [Aurantimonas coralicida]